MSGSCNPRTAEHAARVERARETHEGIAERPLDAVTELTDHLHAFPDPLANVNQAWRRAIRAALAAGESPAVVAKAAGISRECLQRIVEEPR